MELGLQMVENRHAVAGNQALGLLEEQQMLLTAEPSLHSHNSRHKTDCNNIGLFDIQVRTWLINMTSSPPGSRRKTLLEEKKEAPT